MTRRKINRDANTQKTDHPRAIVFVSSEAAPYSKTGGLGDVVGSLPIALASRGHRVMVITPHYQQYPGALPTGVRPTIQGEEITYYHEIREGVDWVFASHPSFMRPGGIYGDENGEYGDNQWRFCLLSHAALEAPLLLQLPTNAAAVDGGGAVPTPTSTYGEDVVFVANDWHAGLVPVLLASHYRRYGVYQPARCILAIHNLKHQGVYSPGSFATLGVPEDWAPTLDWKYPIGSRMGPPEEKGHAVNTLKGAICTADRIMTVSPSYAEEVLTAEGGWLMENVLGSRRMKLNGILNGVDPDEWHPAVDPHLEFKYGEPVGKKAKGKKKEKDVLAGKALNKEALQKELGLEVNPNIPLVAFIGRLDSQKGAELVLKAVPWLSSHNVQMVCLGAGDKGLEDWMKQLEMAYPNHFRGWVGFNVAFSHRLNAGADIFLMPSRFEPCGLNQMYAQIYGTVPVVNNTGGLRDTVEQVGRAGEEGTGWVMRECSEDALKEACWGALELFRHDKEAWRKVMLRGMAKDFTWNNAAQQYEQIFDWAKVDAPYC